MVCGADGSPKLLEELLSIYWSPIYGYLRRRGHDRSTAADLTQGFLLRVLERGLVGRADPIRGRFRTFMLACLGNFVSDKMKQEQRPDGSGAIRFGCNDSDALGAAEPRNSDDPTQAFDRQWATTVVEQAVERMEQTCRASGQDRYWIVFEARELRRARQDCEPVPFEELVKRVGVDKPADVHTLLYRARKMFRQIFRDVVADTVADPSELEDELRAISGYLSA